MPEVIFRLKNDDIYKHHSCFNFDKYDTYAYEEQWSELSRSGYINWPNIVPSRYFLHIYRAFLKKNTVNRDIEIIINIIFNHANKYYFYIDYLYYNKVVNISNFIVFINRRYLVDIKDLGLSEYDIPFSLNENDPRYNKDTHKAIETKCVF